MARGNHSYKVGNVVVELTALEAKAISKFFDDLDVDHPLPTKVQYGIGKLDAAILLHTKVGA
jgi:hypothetical protein